MNPTNTATATACPNIALIKYWGNRERRLNIPANDSISMNMGGLYTRTSVTFDPELIADELTIDGVKAGEETIKRVSVFLDEVRESSGVKQHARVTSENNFPMGAGIASSASAFAALAMAGSKAAGLNYDQRKLSRLARLGSGSACRSVPAGFVHWRAGEDDQSSYAYTIAAPDHWDLRDCVAIISKAHKKTLSVAGHDLAGTSLLQKTRVEDAPRRVEICRQALLKRDFENLAEVVELDSNLMHAVMMTSNPPVFYWKAGTLQVMDAVRQWRRSGLSVCYTVDAGPNVHVLCPGEELELIRDRLGELECVEEVLVAKPGGRVKLEIE